MNPENSDLKPWSFRPTPDVVELAKKLNISTDRKERTKWINTALKKYGTSAMLAILDEQEAASKAQRKALVKVKGMASGGGH